MEIMQTRDDLETSQTLGRLAFPLPTSGVAPGIFRRGAESSDEGAKIWLSGYYKCQRSPKKSLFTF